MPDQLAPLAVRGDVADLEGAPAPADLLEEQAQVVARVEAPVHEIDPDAFPGQRLLDGLQIGQHRGLLVQQTALLVPHRLQHHHTRHRSILEERSVSGPDLTLVEPRDPGCAMISPVQLTRNWMILRIIQLALYRHTNYQDNGWHIRGMRIPLDRSPGERARLPLARQIQLHFERLISQGLLAAGREAAGHARAGAGARRQPHDGGPGLRRAGGGRLGARPRGAGDVRRRPRARRRRRPAPRGAAASTGLAVPLQGRPGHRGGQPPAARLQPGAAARGRASSRSRAACPTAGSFPPTPSGACSTA